jgi:hypothetical protein
MLKRQAVVEAVTLTFRNWQQNILLWQHVWGEIVEEYILSYLNSVL